MPMHGDPAWGDVAGPLLAAHGVTAVCCYDAAERLVAWNERYLEFFPEVRGLVHVGLPFAETARAFLQIQHPGAEGPELQAALTSALWRHREDAGPLRYQRADDGRWLELRMFPVAGGGRVKLWTDVTGAPAAGADSSALLDLLTVANLGITLHDVHGQLRYANSRFFSQHFLRVIREVPDIRQRHERGDYWSRFGSIFEPSQAYLALCTDDSLGALPQPTTLRAVNGRSYRIEEQAWNGGVASLWTDVTELAEREQALEEAHAELTALNMQLQRMANTDALTGLSNRRAFEAALGQAGPSAAVAVIDIDHFKCINDRFGHEAGDQVMTEVARRLIAQVAEGDLLARLGGDEFAALFRATAPEVARRKAQALHAAMGSHPIALDIGEATVTASIGLAWLPHGQTPRSALRRADLALLEAKARGRDQVAVAFDATEAPVAQAVDTSAAVKALRGDEGLDAMALAVRYGDGGEHPVFDRRLWALAYAQGRTLDDYWHWVNYEIAHALEP